MTDTGNYIIIHGDTGSQILTKAVWALLSSGDVRILSTKQPDELYELAPHAALIFILVEHSEDGRAELSNNLIQNRKVVADIIGITIEADYEERIRLAGYGFDIVYNLTTLDRSDFRQVLNSRIRRGQARIESRINEEEYKRFKASLSASPDAFIVFDENRKLFFVSEHYKRAYAESADKLVRGLDVMDAFEMLRLQSGVSDNDERYEKMRNFWLRLEGQEEFSLADGRIWRISAAKLADGQGTIVTTTDITAYSRQQKELARTTAEAEEALRKEKEASAIQTQFINMISHEFRTPLSIIDGNAQIILRRGLNQNPEQLQKRAKTIRSAVSRLIVMMEGVLSSNLLQTGNLTLVPESFDLKRLIMEACEEHEMLAADLNIQCHVDGLPDSVTLDKKVVMLVLGNLLSNAVKFTQHSPEIHVKAWADEQGVKVRVADNGIGIPENEIGRIFDRYYRSALSSGIPGTGIGLSLVKELVALHGGRIEAKSEAGQGTKIVFFLPFGA